MMRLTLLLILVGFIVAQDPGEKDLVVNLPGLKFTPSFNTYAGYLNANDDGTWQMFYVLHESKGNKDTDPLLIWFNGGPGCSSLAGLLEELGPWYVNRDGKTLYENPFSWNLNASVLALESPIGVGFSYSTVNDSYYTAWDDQTRDQNYAALSYFFNKLHPRFKNHTFFLSGESYAGIYIPMLSQALVEGINSGKFPNPNFQGAAIGNGFMDVQGLLNALVLWSAYHARISMKDWAYMKANCTNGADVDTFNFTQYTYSNNSIDYFGNTTTKCGELVQSLISQNYYGDEGFDQYNFYYDCYETSLFQGTRQKLQYFDPQSYDQNTAELVNRASNDNQFGYFCWSDDAAGIWANSPEVLDALHIADAWRKQNNSNYKWRDCNDNLYNAYKLTYSTTNQFFKSVLTNVRTPNFRFLIYNGDIDTVCNYLGDARHIYTVAQENNLNGSDRKPWYFSANKQLAGFVETFTGTNANGVKTKIDLLTVKGAGHMVPFDRPGPSVQMITNFMYADATNGADYTRTVIDANPKLYPYPPQGGTLATSSSIFLTVALVCVALMKLIM